MDELDQRQAKAAINELHVANSLLQIIMVHLVARVANDDLDPGAWLRTFADDVHASIDRITPPTGAQAQSMTEILRDRLDKLVYGVQTRLAR